MQTEPGFSSAELLVVGAIIGLSVTIATPGVLGTMRTERLNTAARQMAQALEAARYEAMRTNNRTQVQFDANSKTYRIITWSGTTPVLGNTFALPPEITFADLPENMTVPAVVSIAAAKADSIPGQEANARKMISFPGSSGIHTATFNAKGMPGKITGGQVEPGTVNWLYLTNSQGERVMLSVTSEGLMQTSQWQAGAAVWVQ